jgi:hypothetical protein
VKEGLNLIHMCPRIVRGLRDPVTLTWRNNPDLAYEVNDLLQELLPTIRDNGHVVSHVRVVKIDPVMIEVAVELAVPRSSASDAGQTAEK